jgi:hypothetical protein
MRKSSFFSLVLAVVFIFGGSSMVAATTSTDSTESNDLVVTARGYILLQVEKRGEAWYVNPENSFRYYMKDGETAYNIMREMGLGISNNNLTKLKAGQKSLVNRLKGRIVLQVEENGEAYYVNPGTGALHYLKDGNAAYSVMRDLSLGITDENISKIPDSDLKTYKAKKTVDKTVSESSNPDGSIVLSGKVIDGQVGLSWSLNDLTSSKGFKVVAASHENPIYPGDKYHYLSDADVRVDSWDELSAGTYYFRVCEYLGGKCGVYSNNLKLVVAESESESDSELISEAESEDDADSQGTISLTGQIIDGQAKLSWTLKDMKSPLGFKVVIDNHENPVYPGNEYHYFSNASVRSDSWSELSAGTYYFRVCEYLGGKCGVYSNNLKLTY